MPELLDELSVARSLGTFKKAIRTFKKTDLLILDEWLIWTLAPQEAYDLLEIIESRCESASIRTRTMTVQFRMQSWTGSCIIPMRS